MMISIDREKLVDKTHHPVTIKALGKLGLERNYTFYRKPSANILNDEEVKTSI